MANAAPMAEAYGGGRAPDGHDPEVVHLHERQKPLGWEPTGVSLRQESSNI